jgi:hypothetical protein
MRAGRKSDRLLLRMTMMNMRCEVFVFVCVMMMTAFEDDDDEYAVRFCVFEWMFCV